MKKSRPFYYLDTLQTTEHFDPLFDSNVGPVDYDSISKNRSPVGLKRRNGMRRAVLNLADRLEFIDYRLAGRVRNCGSRVYWHETVCSHHQRSRIFQARHCGFRLCPACAKRQSLKNMRHISPALTDYVSTNSLFPYLLTLTILNTDELPDRKFLSKARRNFFRSNIFNEISAHGFFWSMEVKVGSNSGKWHVHFHVLVLTESPLPVYPVQSGDYKVDLSISKRVTDAWTKSTNGLGLNTDFRSFDGHYAELLKYVSKGNFDMSDEQLREFVVWSKGLRFKGFAGALYRNSQLQSALKESRDLEKEDDIDKVVCPVCGETRTCTVGAYWSDNKSNFIIDWVTLDIDSDPDPPPF